MATTSIGTLAADLKLNSAKFIDGTKKGTQAIDRFRNRVRLGSIDVNALGRRLAAIATTGAFAAFVKGSAAAADTLTATASKLGLAVTELTRLRFAAQSTNVAVQTFDMAMQRMTRRIAEAAKGTGEAKAAIKELGLDAAELQAAGAAEALKIIADRMQGLATQGDRVRIAMRLFDSESVALVNTLAGGRKAIERLTGLSDRLGVTLDSKVAGMAARANLAMVQLRAAVAALGIRLAAHLAPAITATVKVVTEFVAQLNDANSSLRRALSAIFDWGKRLLAVVLAIKAVNAALKVWRAAMKAAAQAQAILLSLAGPAGWGKIAAGAAVAAAALIGIETAFAKINDEASLAKREIEAAVAAADEAGRGAAPVLAPTGSGVAQSLNELIAEQKSLEQQLAATNDQLRPQQQEMKRLQQAARDAARAITEAAIAVKSPPAGTGAAFHDSLEQLGKASAAVDKLKDSARPLQARLDMLNAEIPIRSFEEMSKVVENLRGQVADFGRDEFSRLIGSVEAIGDSARAAKAEALDLASNLREMRRAADVRGELQSLVDELRNIGATDLEKVVRQFQRLGATESELRQAATVVKKIQAATERAARTESILGLLGPNEITKIEQKLADVNQLLQEGVITTEDAARATEELRKEREALIKQEIGFGRTGAVERRQLAGRFLKPGKPQPLPSLQVGPLSRIPGSVTIPRIDDLVSIDTEIRLILKEILHEVRTGGGLQ